MPPGHSYYRLAQFLADPEQIVGYEEQYAAAAALIARIAELPVRVAVGFEIEPERYVDGRAEVRSGDASAWIEVRVDDVGWVPVSVSRPAAVSPTPRTPSLPRTRSRRRTLRRRRRCRRTSTCSPRTMRSRSRSRRKKRKRTSDEATGGGGIGTLGWIAIGTGSALIVVLAACGVIVVWKCRRTHRRRGPQTLRRCIAGAWLELTDRYQEAGVTTPDPATPIEAVRSMAEVDPAAAATLDPARRPRQGGRSCGVDRTSPLPQAAEVAWRYSDEAVDALLANESFSRRTRMRVDH